MHNRRPSVRVFAVSWVQKLFYLKNTRGGYVDVIDFQTIFDYAMDLIGQNFDLELDIPHNMTL